MQIKDVFLNGQLVKFVSEGLNIWEDYKTDYFCRLNNWVYW